MGTSGVTKRLRSGLMLQPSPTSSSRAYVSPVALMKPVGLISNNKALSRGEISLVSVDGAFADSGERW